jgi:Domain of unknown function (DUF4326)
MPAITVKVLILEASPALNGKNLACWCPLPEPGQFNLCHAAVLLELVRKTRPFVEGEVL